MEGFIPPIQKEQKLVKSVIFIGHETYQIQSDKHDKVRTAQNKSTVHSRKEVSLWILIMRII